MEDLSLHILDIVENSFRAKARNIVIKVVQDEEQDTLILEITDDGEGMDQETVTRAANPFFTTKTGKKVGLGLPLLAQAVEEAEGMLDVHSSPGKGTTVRAVFKLSHIDRKPVGNLHETVRCLRATHPEVHIAFEYITSRR